MEDIDWNILKLKLRRYRLHTIFDSTNCTLVISHTRNIPGVTINKIKKLIRFAGTWIPASLASIILLLSVSEFLSAGKEITQTTIAFLYFYAVINQVTLNNEPCKNTHITLDKDLVKVVGLKTKTNTLVSQIKLLSSEIEKHDNVYSGKIWIETYDASVILLLKIECNRKDFLNDDIQFIERSLNSFFNFYLTKKLSALQGAELNDSV